MVEALLVLCLIGGMAALVGGLLRRDYTLAVLGMILMALSLIEGAR